MKNPGFFLAILCTLQLVLLAQSASDPFSDQRAACFSLCGSASKYPFPDPGPSMGRRRGGRARRVQGGRSMLPFSIASLENPATRRPRPGVPTVIVDPPWFVGSGGGDSGPGGGRLPPGAVYSRKWGKGGGGGRLPPGAVYSRKWGNGGGGGRLPPGAMYSRSSRWGQGGGRLPPGAMYSRPSRWGQGGGRLPPGAMYSGRSGRRSRPNYFSGL